MIYIQMNGRCGNQLFQYTFAQKLKKIYHDECCYNYFYICNRNGGNSSVFDNLAEFQIEHYNKITEEGNMISKHGSLMQKIVYCFVKLLFDKDIFKLGKPDIFVKLNKWQPFINKWGIYFMELGDADIGITKQKNKFVFGTFESGKYYEDLKPLCQKEFQPKNTSGINDDFMNVIKNTDSVCISIRRGDFWSEQYRDERAICDSEYFEKAIEKMQSLREGCTLIFFSDDIHWAKEHFETRYPGSYFESGDNSIAEKLLLMSSCKHFILSNSTFSWWSQFLSSSEDKVVISPSKWLNYQKEFKHSLIDDSWIFIDR